RSLVFVARLALGALGAWRAWRLARLALGALGAWRAWRLALGAWRAWRAWRLARLALLALLALGALGALGAWRAWRLALGAWRLCGELGLRGARRSPGQAESERPTPPGRLRWVPALRAALLGRAGLNVARPLLRRRAAGRTACCRWRRRARRALPR